MHLLSQIILPLLSLLTVVVVASSSTPASTTDILYWPLTSTQPSLLARVSYDPTTLKSDVLSYSSSLPVKNPSSEDSQDVVRVGLYTSSPSDSKHWVGSLTSLSALAGGADQVPTIRLHLGAVGEVYHVSVKKSALEEGAVSEGAASGGDPVVEVVSATAGPRPHLNRPIVVSPEGQGSEEVVEKTLLQK